MDGDTTAAALAGDSGGATADAAAVAAATAPAGATGDAEAAASAAVDGKEEAAAEEAVPSRGRSFVIGAGVAGGEDLARAIVRRVPTAEVVDEEELLTRAQEVKVFSLPLPNPLRVPGPEVVAGMDMEQIDLMEAQLARREQEVAPLLFAIFVLVKLLPGSRKPIFGMDGYFSQEVAEDLTRLLDKDGWLVEFVFVTTTSDGRRMIDDPLLKHERVTWRSVSETGLHAWE